MRHYVRDGILRLSACGARTDSDAGYGPRAFAVGFRPSGTASLTTSEGTGATAFEGATVSPIVSSAARLWERVDIRGDNECWPWLGNRHRSGRGYMNWYGRKQNAPRVVWAVVNGVFPPKQLLVMHSCNNAWCCNPRHLSLGTYLENNRYMSKCGRHWKQSWTHCPNGHPRTPEHVWHHNKAGKRNAQFCRTCRRMAQARYRERKRALRSGQSDS